MPMFKDLWYLPDELIEELRTRFLNDVNSNVDVESLYHSEDIKRVKENDWFIARYLLHHERDVELSLQMLKDSLKFRNDMEVNTVRKKDLPQDYFNVRAVINYNKDKRECPIVVIRTKTHIKREDTRRLQQQYMLYWVEKAVQASNWGVVSILFDCTDAGISNMDLDMIRFVLNVFKKYYPWGLGYFIVYNMPWYLSAFWKMIKNWIPKQYVDKILFVDMTSIREYVDEDQLPIELGGTCTDIYSPKEGAIDMESDNEISPQLVAARS